MKKVIKGRSCDTETAMLIGTKYAGEFGQSDGYEEKLYVTKSKQYFIYGNGGADSKYPQPAIELATDEQAKEWEKENINS